MARNRHFNQYTLVAQEQSVLEDLIVESIKTYGIDAYYLPRDYPNLDKLYGEDPTSKFEDAIEMEVFVKSFDGFQGQQDFISKFGLQIEESITFVVAQKRFTQSLKTCMLTEYSYTLLTEDGDELLAERTDAASYDYSAIIRPREGDLIWIPMMNYLYEIKFTENIENFFQLGKLYTYEMRCDRFEYSSEEINTEISEIDLIEDRYSLSTTNVEKLLTEESGMVLNEDGTKTINEGDTVVEFDVAADNEVIGEKIIEDDVIDFTEFNPFAETRVY
jgi:hypothetical protein